MICTNCFEEEYKTAKTELAVTINGERYVLRDLDCEACPGCGDITFTHAQSLEIDKKRIALEFGVKPLLTPAQLRTLRRVLNMKLDEICDLLHIGRNTYGRWERGEVEITPSMNLLVHSLMEKMPDVRTEVVGKKPSKDNKSVKLDKKPGAAEGKGKKSTAICCAEEPTEYKLPGKGRKKLEK
ncbi:MAG TPA: type II TA system antitoxin MqsA family protein [Geobacteraceae bacterium]